MKTVFTTAASVLAVALVTSASAQEATTFDIDRSGDNNTASYEDFNKGFDQLGYYDSLDADGDGMLSRDEYNRAMFTRYDMDRDGWLNDDEIVGMQNDSMFYSEGMDQAQDEAQTNN